MDSDYPDTWIGSYGLTLMEYDKENLTMSAEPSKVYWGQHMRMTLTPNTNYYLPKTITLTTEGTLPDVGNWVR
jgi:hypothetical protein